MKSGPALAAVGRWRRRFSLRTWKKDVPAGLVLGVESVPDGLAEGLLAGVNPMFGLYGYIYGTIFGALATSSAFMTVQATGAMAVVVSDVPAVQDGGDDAQRALFTLVILTGAIMLALGIAGLGWIVRWVPNAVLTGFVNAVAVNIVLGQLANLTDYQSNGANKVLQAFDTCIHIFSWSWTSVLIGLVTMAVIVTLDRTRVGALGMVVAIIIGSGIAAIPVLHVHQLNDTTKILSSLPTPQLPAFGMMPSLLVPAVALAFVGLVQGAAISKSVPNPDGTYPDASGDFRGQGVANIASGLFHGLPVGGSMSATAIITGAGARSRVAQLVAGVVMLVIVLTLSGLVGFVAMPALAGLLIVVGVKSLKPHQILMVWRTGVVQASVMTATFALTLLIPLQYAVLVGIAISIILHVARQANRVTVRRWVIGDDGAVREVDPPKTLGQNEIVVLRPYGSLFFASADPFDSALPSLTPESRGCVVIVTLRGKEDLGSTFINVITRYAAQLGASGCLLKISGITPHVARQLDATGALRGIGPRNVYPMTSVLAESTTTAQRDAQRWIDDESAPADESSGDEEDSGGDGLDWARKAWRWGRDRMSRRT